MFLENKGILEIRKIKFIKIVHKEQLIIIFVIEKIYCLHLLFDILNDHYASNRI